MLIEKGIVLLTAVALAKVMCLPFVVDQSEEADVQNMRWAYNENNVQKTPCSEMGALCGGELPVVVARRNKLYNGTDHAKTSEGTKKNVFVSQGWGAGGMPFSVLYLNHIARARHPKQQGEPPAGEPMPQPMALTAAGAPHGSYQKVAPRDTPATRRHYSIIPQLFVSYGWGPIGK